jgi:ATP-dependent DNA helicase RecQ
MNLTSCATQYLRQALDRPDASFRDGQWEAIRAVVEDRATLLLVRRTGWGKSMVYFLATRLLRDAGAGPTLLVSPLLALMRNQIEAAARIGVRAASINSTNTGAWDRIEADLRQGAIDVLLISPERLANPDFRQQVLGRVANRIGLFVVDEAHCISDWGHDFRPDYQRLKRILQALPPNVPVLATTATANERVVDDVAGQLGTDVTVSRGPLARASLRLQTLTMPSPTDRMAWLAEHVPQLPGSGIIYALTVRDTERVAQWLRSRGVEAHAYSGRLANDERERLEHALLGNDVKALVATTALSMGFDKPDLGFVIHYQRPGSVVHYYQQVGRAGRDGNTAYGILFQGSEDDYIARYFIERAFPDPDDVDAVLAALEQADDGLKLRALEQALNRRPLRR